MTDKELADRVVQISETWIHPEGWYSAFGYGKPKDGEGHWPTPDYWVCDKLGVALQYSAEEFIHDWRVVGAIMQHVLEKNMMVSVSPKTKQLSTDQDYPFTAWVTDVSGKTELPDYSRVGSDSPMRAIIEACVAAIEADK